MREKPLAKISKAYFEKQPEGDYLVGRVYDHPDAPDGHLITTTKILAKLPMQIETEDVIYTVIE